MKTVYHFCHSDFIHLTVCMHKNDGFHIKSNIILRGTLNLCDKMYLHFRNEYKNTKSVELLIGERRSIMDSLLSIRPWNSAISIQIRKTNRNLNISRYIYGYIPRSIYSTSCKRHWPHEICVLYDLINKIHNPLAKSYSI